jgi:hypothetical protein
VKAICIPCARCENPVPGYMRRDQFHTCGKKGTFALAHGNLLSPGVRTYCREHGQLLVNQLNEVELLLEDLSDQEEWHLVPVVEPQHSMCPPGAVFASEWKRDA